MYAYLREKAKRDRRQGAANGKRHSEQSKVGFREIRILARRERKEEIGDMRKWRIENGR